MERRLYCLIQNAQILPSELETIFYHINTPYSDIQEFIYLDLLFVKPVFVKNQSLIEETLDRLCRSLEKILVNHWFEKDCLEINRCLNVYQCMCK